MQYTYSESFSAHIASATSVRVVLCELCPCILAPVSLTVERIKVSLAANNPEHSQCQPYAHHGAPCNAGAIGLTGATMLATQQADAASEVAQLAAGDNRLSIILTVLLPVAGWVLFNISGPALAQLNNMNKKLQGASGGTKRR